MRQIELLAPAKTADIGIEAIRHGADAVYIGGPNFGARQSASNSVDDIARLVGFAHIYHARVYVTINTILYDDELAEVERLIHQLYSIGVDALIIQDMGILQMNIPPIPLHASTQMNNQTADKVKWLSQLGFRQVVLARELTTEQIREIHRTCPDTLLEVFVHGALCVSYNGQCYASQSLCHRSANRGECAQVCRMAFTLHDGKGHDIVRDKHLLSLKDLCQLNILEELLDAGASSLKIEGRLKDADYVKNVTAAYSEALNSIIARHPDKYCRASSGRSTYTFTPNVAKSFNRGFTNYFIHGRKNVEMTGAGRQADEASVINPYTPKSIGEYVGKVKDLYTTHFTMSGTEHFNNGDGLCYIDRHGKLVGFRINKVVDDRGVQRLFPMEIPRSLVKGTHLYRNLDMQFSQLLQRPSATRSIGVTITMTASSLTMTDEDGITATVNFEPLTELARTPQRDNIIRQLTKLGDTPFIATDVDLQFTKNYFIPSSQLAQWRRSLTADMQEQRLSYHPHEHFERTDITAMPTANTPLTYLANIANHKAKALYQSLGHTEIESAFELRAQDHVRVMTCKHCIRHALGMCLKQGSQPGDLYLRLANGTNFKLSFDCKKCVMHVLN